MTAQPVTIALDCRCKLGESPVWSVAEQALYFVDIKGQALHRFDPASGAHRAMPQTEDIGCVALSKAGGFVAGFRSGVWRLDAEGRAVEKLADNPEDQALSRFNDGRVDPAGRLVLGTIDEKKAGAIAHLYRYDRRGLAPLVDKLTTSNGLAFSRDGRTMFHADTPQFTVWAYDYDPAAGTIANRRVFARWTPTDTDRGRPDGAAIDAEGCYWSALYEGGRIQRYAPDGTLLAEYKVPARCPTMVAFGGPDLKTIFVTSASADRPADELAAFPHSGSLFSLRVDVPGVPEPLFDPAA